ncbi:MAG: signal peptidase II [Planctomycetota bacterium]|nr:signal peptidase II [Planctomycetota bacterium]
MNTAATTAEGAEPKVLPGPRAVAVRLGIAVVLVAADLWSKAAAFAWIERLDQAGRLVVDSCGSAHRRQPIVGEWFTFMLSLNPGAAFGQLHSIPYLLVSGRAVAVVFLVWLLVRTPRGRPWFTSALVLVLGGALGNLYDNLLRPRDLVLDRFYPADRFPFGPVRDFIDVYFDVWRWHFPTFNVADSCITVGAILLLASGFLGSRSKGSGAAA